MPRRKQIWFRFYTEAAHDTKLRQLTPTHRWLWVSVLSAVRESPLSGKLMLTQCLAMSEPMLSDYAAMRAQDVRSGLKLLQSLGLIEWDEQLACWSVPTWSERQFESDDVAIRVANHRYKKQRSNVTTPLPVTTLQHTRDIDIDIDIEKEAKASLAEQGKCITPETSLSDKSSEQDDSRVEVIHNPVSPSAANPRAKATRQSRSTTTATTSVLQARKRDPLFDAMAVACGHDLENLTKSEGTAIGSAVAEVRHKAGITPQVIHDKAQAYRSMHPDWELTPRALVKHWSALQQTRTPWTDPRQKELADLREEYGAKDDFTDRFIKHIQGSAKPPELPPGEVPAEPLRPNQVESNKNTMPAIEIRATETTDSSPSASEEPKERHKPPRRELLEKDWG